LDIINSLEECEHKKFDGIILAVAHNEFLDIDIQALRERVSVIYDVKGVLPKELIDKRL
jgi:UDP-N-acetyl-D-galactosamine dehydrogenase